MGATIILYNLLGPNLLGIFKGMFNLNYLCTSSDLVENTVESSPNVTVNSIDDGVSGSLLNIENHTNGNIIIVNMAIIIPPPTNSLNIQDTFSPRLLSTN